MYIVLNDISMVRPLWSTQMFKAPVKPGLLWMGENLLVTLFLLYIIQKTNSREENWMADLCSCCTMFIYPIAFSLMSNFEISLEMSRQWWNTVTKGKENPFCLFFFARSGSTPSDGLMASLFLSFSGLTDFSRHLIASWKFLMTLICLTNSFDLLPKFWLLVTIETFCFL